jgi:hypothetical protein
LGTRSEAKNVSGAKGYSMEDAMRDKMVKVGVAATAVALAAGAFGGVALAGDHGEVIIGGNGGNGGNAKADCGVSAQIPILAPILGLNKFAPQCDAWGGAGGQGGPAGGH